MLFKDNYPKDVPCNEIGKFFVGKITKIRQEIEATALSVELNDLVPDDQSLPICSSNLDCFKKLPENDVRSLVLNSSKKHCALDPMPYSLIADCLDVLLLGTTQIVNSSLFYGHVPKNWKEALVKPLLMKSGISAALNVLRPISNLKFISKLTERAVCNQSCDHL